MADPTPTPSPLTGPRRTRSAYDAALQAIGRAIVSGRFPVGSTLPSKEELMDQLDVSLTTLREALQTLTAKGMLVAKARVGTRVLPRARWNMLDADLLAWHQEDSTPASFLSSLLEIRQTIEPVAAALAAVRRSEQDVAHLRALIPKLDIDTSGHRVFVEADLAFHQCILQASGNPFMQSIASLIDQALSTSLTLSAPKLRSADGSTVQQQHLRVADAIAARNAQEASDAMMAVIREGWIRNSGCRITPLSQLQVASFTGPL